MSQEVRSEEGGQPNGEVEGVFSVSIDLKCLTGGGLWVSVIQDSPVNVDAIKSDSDRPKLVSSIRELLQGEGGSGTPGKLDDEITGQECSLLVAPEYSFGSSDWTVIDKLVRQRASSLILIAGFGATPGAWLESWCQEGDCTTERIQGWSDSFKPSSQKRYNGGWCWVHSGNGHTRCIVFLKNHLEQRDELDVVEDIDSGREIVRVELDDLILFPLICADMLQTSTDRSDVMSRIQASLEDEGSNKKRLVVGSLLQGTPHHPAWQNAIGRALGAIGEQLGLVVLANHAVSEKGACEEEDKWRALSGVFAVGQRHLDRKPMPQIRRLQNARYSGVVIRSNDPCLATGKIRWDESHGSGRYLWLARQILRVGADGGLTTEESAPLSVYEVRRRIRRSARVESQVPGGKEGLLRVEAKLEDSELADTIVASLVHGVTALDQGLPLGDNCPDNLGLIEVPLLRGLVALGLLGGSAECTWSSGARQMGALTLSSGKIRLLVWSDPRRSAGQIMRALEVWSQEPGAKPSLLAIVLGQTGTPNEGFVSATSRTDVSQPFSAEGTRDILHAQSVRTVMCAALPRLENVYEEDTEEEVRSAVEAFVCEERRLMEELS